MTSTTDNGSQPLLRITTEAGVETWHLANAPVNALSPELLEELETAITRVTELDDIAVVVISSDLRVFSAGADATWMAETVAEIGSAALVDAFNVSMDRFRAVCLSLRKLPALVIAAIDGHALAGGLELAAACDLRFCSDSEKVQLGVPEMDLFGAMPSGGGGVQYLTRLMGPSRALEFVLEAKPITPERAYAVGLIERLAPAGDVLTAAQAFAAQVATKAGRIGVSAAKRSMLGGAELPLEQALDLDHGIHWHSMRNGNFVPGVEAFVARFGSSTR